MAHVVERADPSLHARGCERRLEAIVVPLRLELRPPLRVAEHVVVVGAERRGRELLGERIDDGSGSAMSRSPSSDFDSSTRRVPSTRFTCRQRSPCSSEWRRPVSARVRNTLRARLSENALQTRGTSTGSRIRHRLRSTFGRWTFATGFVSTSCSLETLAELSGFVPRHEAPVVLLDVDDAGAQDSATPSVIQSTGDGLFGLGGRRTALAREGLSRTGDPSSDSVRGERDRGRQSPVRLGCLRPSCGCSSDRGSPPSERDLVPRS